MLYFFDTSVISQSFFMEPNIFSPRLKQNTKDTLSGLLRSMAQGLLTLVFGLLPIFFVPGVYTALGFTKSYFVAVGLFAALVLLSLSILRSGSVRVVFPPALAFFWAFALIAIVSGVLSGDVNDALYGNVLEVHTAAFVTLMALVMTLALAFAGAKAAVARIFMALGVSALLLQLYHIVRLFAGSDFLSFGLFTSATVSPLGSFNDLAIFSGWVLLIVLVMWQQIASTLYGRIVSAILIVTSLCILAVINFYTVWLVVGFFSLLMVLYLVSRDTWLKSPTEENLPVSRFALSVVGFVCLISGAFIISGDYLGGLTSRLTQINYLEIRPSIASTLSITHSVLSENALLGTGPNRFEDAWRQYKNPVINQTPFWNTNFSAGSGYIPTLFVTTGLAGGAFVLLFLGAFLYLGYRTLFTTVIKDSGWYLVGTVSFISAIYLWLMAIVYVPGVSILLLASLMTGLTLAAYVTVRSDIGVAVDVAERKQYGLLLIAAVLILIISSVLSVIGVSKQFVASEVYADTVRAFQTGAGFVETDAGLKRAQDLNVQDIFTAERAQLRLAELRALGSQESTALTQQRYSTLLTEGIELAKLAVFQDATNPNNYIVLSNFYGLLDPAQFTEARAQNESLFAKARELDPTNPVYLVLLAQYKAQVGDLAAAREHLMEAVRIKGDYTDALFLLSQLDIQEGKVEDAIAVTSAIVSLEPTNPTRYFQLGILLATTNNLTAATEAFENAVSLDTNYANARYFLALTYLDQNRKDDALIQLRLVEQTNSDNAMVKDLINQVETGTYQKPQASFGVPVESGAVVSQDGDVTTATEVPDTSLVTPLNKTSIDGQEEIIPETKNEIVEESIEETGLAQ
jgi:tetratricopeptide (TPR) repeat protein